MTTEEMLTKLGSTFAGIMFVWAMFQQYFPRRFLQYLEPYTQKLVALVYPYISITFHELSGQRLKPSDAYMRIQNYLSVNSTSRVTRLKASDFKGKSLVLSMDDYQEVTDEFNGVKVWWASSKRIQQTQTISWHPSQEERRFYTLKFHRRDRDMITKSYIEHVMREGKAIGLKNRERKLYTNNPSKDWHEWAGGKWSHVLFEHPATFDTLAMETKKKNDIIKDLNRFRQGKEYYAKMGKAWKRGYLLYGPPGTGKSTMIAAMANYLEYDIYDLELTTVKDNTDLRKLLISITNKSIVVIEDIDCSLNLTGQRKPKEEIEQDVEGDKKDPVSEKKKEEEKEEKKESKVTLSGLLNFIDGIWSSCGGERVIIFTTNYVEKLDSALIRKGRMDKHIEMSYCSFEAFKVLAKNYLDIEWHESFAKIESLLKEVNMSPADVAENLMRMSDDEDDVEICLKNLIEAAEDEKKKAEEEAKRLKTEESKEVKENGHVVSSTMEVEQNGVITSEDSK